MPSLLKTIHDSSLDSLGVNHNCDKSSVDRKTSAHAPSMPGHDYLRKYQIFLEGYTSDIDFSMLELGAGPDWNMGSSLKIWKDYFPLAKKNVIADINESAKELEKLGKNKNEVS